MWMTQIRLEMIQTVMKVGTLEVEGYYNKWWGKYFTHYNVDQKDGSGAHYNFPNKCKC